MIKNCWLSTSSWYFWTNCSSSIRFKKEKNLICKLNQSLYELKQSFQIWYETLTKFLQEIDFKKNQWDVRFWFDRKQQIYLTIYINDVKLIRSDEADLDAVHQQIADRFEIKNLDKIHHYLNMKMIYDHQQQKIHLSQKQYIQQLLK